MNKLIRTYLLLLCAGTSAAMAQNALVNNLGALITIKQGAQVIVKADSVNLKAGTLNNAGDLTVEGNFTIGTPATATGNASTLGTYKIAGNWENNGNFNAQLSEVQLNGANQLITGSSITTFHNLSLLGTGVKTQTIHAITANILALNDRELATDWNRMTVTNTSLAAITRTSGFVSSQGSGRLLRNTQAIGSYLFPTGSSLGTLRYRPITLEPTSAAANTYAVRMINNDASNDGFSRNQREADICEVNPNFYHFIGHPQGSTNPHVTMYYDLATDGTWELNGFWDNSPQWKKMPKDANTSLGGLTGITTNNWNNFSNEAFALLRTLPVIVDANAIIEPDYCNPNSGQITGLTVTNVDASAIYIWRDASGNILSNSIDLIGVAGGTYTLTVIKPATGCQEDQTFTIPSVPDYTWTIAAENISCFGANDGSIDLTIQGGFPPYSVTWNGVPGQDRTNLGPGTYNLVISDSRGCVRTDQVIITQPPRLVSTLEGTSPETCEQVNGTADVTISGGTPPYTYTWNTTPPQYTEDATGLLTGNYALTAVDDLGCSVTQNVSIGSIPTPVASFEASIATDIEVLLSDATVSFENTTPTASGYIWDFGNGESSSLTNPKVTYTEPGVYFVTLTAFNSVGCTDDFILGPFIIIPNGALYFPNAFTPNGDGRNDEFGAVGEGVVQYQMEIFDRWGNSVKILTAITDRWDGTLNGQDVPEGAYTYRATATLNDGRTLNRAGTITVIR